MERHVVHTFPYILLCCTRFAPSQLVQCTGWWSCCGHVLVLQSGVDCRSTWDYVSMSWILLSCPRRHMRALACPWWWSSGMCTSPRWHTTGSRLLQRFMVISTKNIVKGNVVNSWTGVKVIVEMRKCGIFPWFQIWYSHYLIWPHCCKKHGKCKNLQHFLKIAPHEKL